MRMIDIIGKKRDGESLNGDEIQYFVQEYTAGLIPDYQVSALLMAIIFRGMDRNEIVALTIAMAESGDMLICPILPTMQLTNIRLAASATRRAWWSCPWLRLLECLLPR